MQLLAGRYNAPIGVMIPSGDKKVKVIFFFTEDIPISVMIPSGDKKGGNKRNKVEEEDMVKYYEV
jgi:hypothetical protein